LEKSNHNTAPDGSSEGLFIAPKKIQFLFKTPPHGELNSRVNRGHFSRYSKTLKPLTPKPSEAL